MKKLSMIFLSCSLSLIFCTQIHKPDNSSKSYYDLQTFFATESESLQKENPQVKKTITKNNITETKNTTIKNWAEELELFSVSDINKPAWNNAYQITVSRNRIQYSAKDKSLKTKEIIIERSENGNVKHISILNGVNNGLYTSSEELHYFPDSLYSIRKKQTILIVGDQNYLITGRIASTRK